MLDFDFLVDGQALLVTDYINRKYFSGIDHEEGYVVATKKGVTYFADLRSYSLLAEKLESTCVTPKVYKDFSSLKSFFESQNIKSVYLDYGAVSVADFNTYKKLGVKIVDGGKVITKLRVQKTQTEIEKIERACQIAQTAFEMVLPYIKRGVSELSIKNRLVKKMIGLGAESESFSTIVAFGKNTACPHHETGNTKLKNNQPVLIDWGCKYQGYCSDITRTFFYGTPTKQFEKIYNLVATANDKCQKYAKQGVLVKSVDKVARDYFTKHGVGEHFTHSLGHGIGLQIHEQPFLSPKGKGRLSNGVPFTIEPGLYFDGEFGVRIENTVIIKDGKAVSLTGDGKPLLTI